MAIGGGHGLARSLGAARRYAGRITAIVSVADDGGSSGRLRDALQMPAPGDVRRCLVALLPGPSPLGDALEHRFDAGELEGHAFGNLLIAALAAERPATSSKASTRPAGCSGPSARCCRRRRSRWCCVAEVGDEEVEGQVADHGPRGASPESISSRPTHAAPPEVLAAIATADQIVIGPGSLYTSILAALAPVGVVEALAATTARRIYVANLREQVPETAGYDVGRHVAALSAHGIDPDVVLADTATIALGALPAGIEVAKRARSPASPERRGLATTRQTLGAGLLAAMVVTPTCGQWLRMPAEPGRDCRHAIDRRRGEEARSERDCAEMTVRVAVNGFGRIGRNFVRALHQGTADVELVGINDIASLDANAHLLRYDSTHGRFAGKVVVEERALVVDGHEIAVFAEREPGRIPWGEVGVDVVIESTGRFTKRAAAAAHVDAGAKRVIVSAPSDDADATFVVGVNDDTFDPAHHFVVSNASCTTNCFVPMVKVLDDAFGVEQGLMTTVHAYTNDQELLDLARDNLRRARAAAVNIVPTATGAARATDLVLQSMKGRLDGVALRVPVQDGSITDFTAIVGAEVDVGDGQRGVRRARPSSGRLARVLAYTEDPIVSTDIVGSAASCTFDAELTRVVAIGDGATLVKVFGWYDNEWGYFNRLVDLVEIVGGCVEPRHGAARSSRTSARSPASGSSCGSTSTSRSRRALTARRRSPTTSASAPRCRPSLAARPRGARSRWPAPTSAARRRGAGPRYDVDRSVARLAERSRRASSCSRTCASTRVRRPTTPPSWPDWSRASTPT